MVNQQYTTKYTFDDIRGNCVEIRTVIKQAQKIALLDDSILITGETGTGKEMFAQAIHHHSNPGGPFIAVNCASLPTGLIESELFGYEPGAFTGASPKGMPGKIELANNGTLFLDEIGDMPIPVQAVLLRVLEDRYVCRLGSNDRRKAEFRLISATNKNLHELQYDKTFRRDLYFRIASFQLHIPPLRERGNDFELLWDYFTQEYCNSKHLPIPDLALETRRILHDNFWPGNVREVQSTVRYLIGMSDGLILPQHLPYDVLVGSMKAPPKLSEKNAEQYRETRALKHPAGNHVNLPKTTDITYMNYAKVQKANTKSLEDVRPLREIENDYIRYVVRLAENNIAQAAWKLGITKATLYKHLRQMGYDLTEERIKQV